MNLKQVYLRLAPTTIASHIWPTTSLNWVSWLFDLINDLFCLPIEISLVHVSLLSESCDKEPQYDHYKCAAPYGIWNLIPHLLVELMDFLHSLEIVQFWGGIGQGPHSQIVHMGQEGPVVSEGNLSAWLQELILELWLSITAWEPGQIS